MPTFAYTAKDKMGQEIERTQEAASKEALIKSLRDEGLFPTSIEEQKTSTLAKKAQKKQFSFSFGKRVGLKDLLFCRQFATMINTGVSCPSRRPERRPPTSTQESSRHQSEVEAAPRCRSP